MNALAMCRLLTTALIIASAATASARAQTAAEIEAWMKKLWADTQDFNPPEPVEIRWTFAAPAVVSAETLTQWKREVEGKPEHPRRSEIPVQERRLHDGPDKGAVTLLYADSALWRQIENHPYNLSTLYSDAAFDGHVCWHLNSQSLSLWDGRDKDASQAAERRKLALLPVQLFLSQALSLTSVGRDSAVLDIAVKVGGWTARTRSASGGRSVVTGSWDSGQHVGIVSQVQIWPPKSEKSSMTVVMSGHRYDHELNRLIPGRILRSGATMAETIDYLGSKKVSRSVVAAAAAPPDPLGSDSVHGPLKLKRVNDYTGSMALLKINDGTPGWAEHPLGTVPTERSWLKWFGWSAVAAILVTIVVMRVRASRYA